MEEQNFFEKKMPATLENIPILTEFTDGVLESMDFPMKGQMQIDIALDELLSNVAHYAYKDKGSGDVTLRISRVSEPEAVAITFIDSGIPYNPLVKDDPDITSDAEDRAIGGLGIFMTRKLMDDMLYEYTDGKNILTIIKKF